MVARPCRELDVAQLSQLPTHGRIIERHRELVVQPLHQVDQPPADNAVDCRDRTALDNLGERLPLGIIEPGTGARRLAVKQAFRTAGVEPHNPVAHNLQTHRSEEHTSALQSLMRNSYAAFCLKKKTTNLQHKDTNYQ